MKHYNNYFIVFLLLITVRADAGTLTLKECLERADNNNPTLKAEIWDTRIAEENIRQVSSTSFPRIDAQAGYTMQQAAQAVVINGIKAETQEPDFAFGGLSIGYTIYDFGRRNARKQQARSLADSTANMFEARRHDIALQVIETYFGILEVHKLVAAAQEEVSQVEMHRRVAQVFFEEGVVTRNDVLQADVRLATARQNLLAISNRHENAWLQLNYQTGAEQTFRSGLDDDTTVTSIEEKAHEETNPLAKRQEILALRKRVEAGDADVLETRSNFFPEIYSRLSLDYVQNDKVREETIMAATIGFKINLFDGFASTSAREKAVHSRSKSQDILRQAEAQVRLEIATAQNDVRMARERIAVTETTIRQSAENLRINHERYQERVGTATEVLDAQTLLTQTKTDHYRAIYDHQVASARLKRAIGEL